MVKSDSKANESTAQKSTVTGSLTGGNGCGGGLKRGFAALEKSVVSSVRRVDRGQWHAFVARFEDMSA